MWFLIGTISRWLLFTGLLVAFGAVSFRVAVLRRDGGASESRAAGTDADADGGFDAARAAARIGMVGAALVALGALGRLGSEISVFRDPLGSLGSQVNLLLRTTWGKAWIGQIVFASVGLAAFALAAERRGVTRAIGWVGAAAAVVLLSYTPAFSGHAVGAERFVTATIWADGFHVMAGGMWLGTLAVMAGVVREGRRRGDPVTRERLVSWLVAFSPIALGCAAVIGATGLFGAWLHLDAVSSLWAHPYGRRLSLKVGLLLIVVGCGAYNWKRSQGRVEASGNPPRLPATVAIELSLGLALLLVTALLVTTPAPGH